MGSNPIGALEMSPILIRSQNLVNCSMKVISFMTVTLLAVLRSSFTFKGQILDFFLKFESSVFIKCKLNIF